MYSSAVSVSSFEPKELTGSPQDLLKRPRLAQYASATTPEIPANAARMPPILPLLPLVSPSPNSTVSLCVGGNEIVGAAVGIAVGGGEGLGVKVGRCVGCSVGDELGGDVGELEGAALGEAVGLDEGIIETVGSDDGALEGLEWK